MKIKKGDLVQVISGGSKDRGGDKGKQGRVLAVNKLFSSSSRTPFGRGVFIR